MKNNHSMWAGTGLLIAALGVGIYGMSSSMASSRYNSGYDSDEHERDEHNRSYSISSRFQNRVNPLYEEECGSCHMAYPASLLPPEGWLKNLDNLAEHYDENAEVDVETLAQLESYLIDGSASLRFDYRRWMRRGNGEIPARITELPNFQHEHDEIPLKYVSGNDKVNSFSQCNACHKSAQQGDFDEDNVVIPGVGRWDD